MLNMLAGSHRGVMWRGVGAVAVVGGLILAGCGSTARPHNTNLTTVTFAGFPASTISLPVYTAQALGYFRAEGLRVKIVQTQAGSAAVNALISGSVQFTTTTVPQIAGLIPQGVHIEIVANSFGRPSNVVMCRDAVAMPNANRFPQVMSDFVGKTVGITSFGSSTDQLIRYSMIAAGLNPASVHEVQLGATGLIPAMESGSVDCIVSFEPLTQELIAQHNASSVLAFWHGVGPSEFRTYTSISIGASAQYIKTHESIVKGFSKAIFEADKIDASPANADRLAKLLAGEFAGTGVASLRAEIAAVASQVAYFVTPSAVANAQTVGLALGVEKAREPYADIVDTKAFASHYVGPGQ